MARTRLPMRAVVSMRIMVSASLLFGACGDEGSDQSPPDEEGPTASFVAPESVEANEPAVFDASGSSSSDGSELGYFWDFGDGRRGGGRMISHLYATGGVKAVTLTVTQSSGAAATASKTLTVADPAAPTGTVSVEGRVTTTAGLALEGVTVSEVGRAATATTDAMGSVRLMVGTGVSVSLKLTKPGYADQLLQLLLPTETGDDGYFAAVMRMRDPSLSLADAAAGGTLDGRDGARLSLPPNGLAGRDGSNIAGAVQAALTPVDATERGGGGFPGSFDGLTAEGDFTPIVSFGAVEYALTAGGQSLQLAAGKAATIEIPIYATVHVDGSSVVEGDLVPLWSLDESTGVWIQEGDGLVVTSDGSPTGLALRALVTHLSWWNADLGFDPYGPGPRCVYDTNIGLPGANDTFATATICNLLAEIDRGPTPGGPASEVSSKADAALPPRVAGYARRVVLPIEGGVTVPVPADVDVALEATALNGSWEGRTVVNGPVGLQKEELIKMRPVTTTGPDAEPIEVPFDSVRALAEDQVALFRFEGAAYQYARVTVSQGNGSTLGGRVRLLQGVVPLATAEFSQAAGQLVALLPVAGAYTVEVSPLSDAPGAYRLQVELLGGVQEETLSLPFDLTETVPTFTTYRGSFAIDAPTTVWLAWRPQVGADTMLRLVAPDGGTLVSLTSQFGALQSSVVRLPVAGTYAMDLAPAGGQSATVRVAASPTSWEPVGPALEGPTTSSALVDLVADVDGKLVVGYTRAIVNPGLISAVVMLRRWTGAAWEVVGSDLTIERTCNQGIGSVAFAFDSNNDPVVAYGNTTMGSETFVAAKRFSAGAWRSLGPNDGRLSATSAFDGACSDPPVIAPGPNGSLAIAYRADNDVVIQRYDGAAWVGIEGVSEDRFAGQYADFDLAADPNGRLHFVMTSVTGAPSVARRLSTGANPVWQPLGPNGGTLPQTNTAGLGTPRLRFGTAGNPVIGVTASIGSTVFYTGTAIYRYDGAQWMSTGGYSVDSSYVNNGANMGFDLLGSDAFMGWVNTRNSQNAPIVQKNDSSGWAPVGDGVGEIPQYTANGFNDKTGYSLRLRALGSDLFVALIVQSPSEQPPFRVVLLRKVSD